MIDSAKRSVLKSVTWRIMAVCSLATVSYLMTRDLAASATITAAYHMFQILVFYAHERLWANIAWGRTRGLFVQMTGLSGAGKSTIAKEVQRRMRKRGIQVEVIDGDEYREGICKDLGFSKEDRNTNIRRLGFIGKVLARNNVVAIMSTINPYEDIRKELRKNSENVKTVLVACNLEELKNRDPKGLYAKALLPDDHPEKIHNFTGISDPFDPPLVCDLTLRTDSESIEESVIRLSDFILDNIGE